MLETFSRPVDVKFQLAQILSNLIAKKPETIDQFFNGSTNGFLGAEKGKDILQL